MASSPSEHEIQRRIRLACGRGPVQLWHNNTDALEVKTAQAKHPRVEKGFDPRMQTQSSAQRLTRSVVQILRLSQKAGMVRLGHVALDGTKVKANTSKKLKRPEPRLRLMSRAGGAAQESCGTTSDGCHAGIGLNGQEHLPAPAPPSHSETPDASHNKGFEPKTLIENRKRAAGIEPASSAWKAEVLPLNYARSSTDAPGRCSGTDGRPGRQRPWLGACRQRACKLKHYDLRA